MSQGKSFINLQDIISKKVYETENDKQLVKASSIITALESTILRYVILY